MTANIIIQSVCSFMEADNLQNDSVNHVLIAVRQILTCDKVLNNIEQQFDKIISDREMNSIHLMSMIGLIPIILIEIQKIVQVSKSLKLKEIKYVIYAVLYKYILTHQQSFLYEVSEEGLCAFYDIAWNLVKIVPETVKISKGLVVKCCAFKTTSKTEPII